VLWTVSDRESGASREVLDFVLNATLAVSGGVATATVYFYEVAALALKDSDPLTVEVPVRLLNRADKFRVQLAEVGDEGHPGLVGVAVEGEL
jgi:hypothetical protein